MNTVLLTLGRLPVALDIARSFDSLGWRVVIAEPAWMHLARMSNAVARCYRVTAPVQDAARYLSDLASIVETENVNLVVPVSEESMHVAGLRPLVDERVNIFCRPQPDMLALHDKYRFVQQARQLGLRVPETSLAGDPAAKQIARAAFVSKPRYSCSGRGVARHEAGAAFEAGNDIVVQQRLDGAHYSSFAVARDGRIVVGSVYRGTVTDGSVAVAFERIDDMTAIESWASNFVAETKHTGFIAFDFIVDDNGEPSAIECNPRATSGIHFIDTDALAAAILDKPLPVRTHRKDTHLTEAYSCYTATLAALFSEDDFGDRLRQLRDARDVTWSRRDPWPFLLMMINTYRIVGLSLFGRRSFAEAAVLDIEWRGAPEAVS